MLEWFDSFSMEWQVFIAAGLGMLVAVLFCFFGEVLTPDDII